MATTHQNATVKPETTDPTNLHHPNTMHPSFFPGKSQAKACLSLLIAIAYSVSIAQTGPKLRPAAQVKLAANMPVARTPEQQIQPTANNNAAEARLLDIYRKISQDKSAEAIILAEQLAKDFPNFGLAQMVYADLLLSRTHALTQIGNIQDDTNPLAQSAIADLRTESLMRMKALRERPPTDALPAELLRLSNSIKYAIAVDTSRARLYLFENKASGLQLTGDYYVSIGKLGTDKQTEGDLRTPTGIYFINGQIEPKILKDLYGVGALPINYPNELDRKRGKTGSGIWLHGTLPSQFSRPPQDSNGCVVLANHDLTQVLNTIDVRNTPVVIAQHLDWVKSEKTQSLNSEFESQLKSWLAAKASGNVSALAEFYSPDFNQNGKPLTTWMRTLRYEISIQRGKSLEIDDLSLLHWVDNESTMVVTFGELVGGKRSNFTRNQYWNRTADGQWKIFYEQRKFNTQNNTMTVIS